MPRVVLNPAWSELRGALGRLVVRQTMHGPVLSQAPDMSRVKWSPAQIARRRLMEKASIYYREVMANPKQAARYRALAKKKKIPVSSFVMGEYLRRGGPPPR